MLEFCLYRLEIPDIFSHFNRKNSGKTSLFYYVQFDAFALVYYCLMYSRFIPSNSVLLIGGITTLILIFIFVHIKVIFIHSDTFAQPVFLLLNGVAFILTWLFLSFMMNRYSIKGVLYVLSFLAVAGLADHHLPVSKNPITIPLIYLFWLGLGYLIQPQFFDKYKIAIFSVFGLLMCYYFYHFMTTPDYGPQDRGSFANLTLLPIPVFAALWTYEQWRWLKSLQSDKTKAELALLKSQINPHFFFNTLNNLYGLTVEKSDRAPEVVLKISEMMRYTIYEGEKERVNLQDEIKYLETYIELHKIRHQKKVDIQFVHKVDGTLQIAPLLFIILLENAFKHGVEKVREGAFIHMQMKSEGNNIFFEIKNSSPTSASDHKGGIGLDNLQRRLNYVYANHHELTIEENESVFVAQLTLTLA